MTLPLEGVRVIDLSSLLPGSLCGQMLGDLGADVIKIEKPGAPDGLRTIPPLVKTMGSSFHIVGRNKRSMSLDLQKPAGMDIFLKMIPGTDVLIDSFRPGGMERIGLGHAALKDINPRIVHCSITGFGQDGPYRDNPSHDINLLALSGILDLTGQKNGPPAIPGIQVAGVGGGLNAVIGILSALLLRERTGQGIHIDASLLDSLTPFLGLVMSAYMATGIMPRRGDSFVGGGFAFSNVYETGDGKYLALGCLEKKFWQGFCHAIEREDLIADQFATGLRQEKLISEVGQLLRQKTREEWLDIFSRHNTRVSPVNSLEEALGDPQVKHRKLWFRARHPLDGEICQQGFPVKFSRDQPRWTRHPPSPGEQTGEILREMGYTADNIAGLESEGIISL
ncbi:MAG: CaiB/BaiF CoA-transferase family protein [Syntrophales bacterium]|nr:CaiB/BaiF CoA-transferase family protein [Syntrophales bacterium]